MIINKEHKWYVIAAPFVHPFNSLLAIFIFHSDRKGSANWAQKLQACLKVYVGVESIFNLL